MGNCCQLGEILTKESDRVLYETDNFFVAPTLGQIDIEGYLLILSKECDRGIGDIPEKLYKELEEVIETTRKVIKSEYGLNSRLFEHGPKICSIRGGGCLDHAHLHVIPGIDVISDLSLELMAGLDTIGQLFRTERIDSFKRAGEIYNAQKNSYMIVESTYGQRVIVDVNFHIPSQYLRRLVADKMGSDKWDWRRFPCEETMGRTVDRLSGKF